MKNKTKEIHNSIMKIGAAILALAVAAGASTPAITSFTQAQPVTKTKKKAKKKTKAKTTVLKTLTLIKGKSKTVSVKTKSKVKWTSSNAKVASVKSISKSKVNVYAKKEGSTKVSGKAGSTKWSFTVKVKKANKKPTGNNGKSKTNKTNASQGKDNNKHIKNNAQCDVVFSNSYFGALEDNDTINYNGTDDASSIATYSKEYKKIKYTNLTPDTIKINFVHYIPISSDSDIPGKGEAACNITPIKAGKASVKASYPGGEKIYNFTVKETNCYKVAKNVITKVKNSSLDDAHKAFVLAKWIEKRATYDRTGEWGGIAKLIIEGKGICQDYTDTFSWLLNTVGIKNRRVATDNHTWNQIEISGKWYNIDVTMDDSDSDNIEDFNSTFFMKSDSYSKLDEFNPNVGRYYPFNEGPHKISERGDGCEANGIDYDNYNWLQFYQSDQFKALIS